MKQKHFPLYILLLFFVALSCNKEEQQSAAPPPKTYPVIAVPMQSITAFNNYPATIQGTTNNEVRAKIQGYIQKVYVDEGQMVRKGQTLFRLETASLDQTANASRSAVKATEATISSAQSNIEVAQVEVDKLKPLVEKGIISPIQLKTAEANLMTAKSQLNQAQAAKSQAQANLQSVQANINYSNITAPISGVIGSLQLREGSLVGPNTALPITTISDTRELYAYFSMNESEYLNFLEQTEGSTLQKKINHFPMVDLELANGSIYSEKGKVETVTGQIDPSTGTIQFRVLFSNESGLLSNGNTGIIRIPKMFENVLVVPESATVDQQGLIHVFKIEQDTAISTIIKVKERVNNVAIVEDGVSEGDLVVAQGIGALQNRTPVRPKVVDFDSIVQAIKPIF